MVIKNLNRSAQNASRYPEIENALHQLTVIEDELKGYVNTITFDLADLRGYHYHTGMVFAAMCRKVLTQLRWAALR